MTQFEIVTALPFGCGVSRRRGGEIAQLLAPVSLFLRLCGPSGIAGKPASATIRSGDSIPPFVRARTCSGHPRKLLTRRLQPWLAGASPAMNEWVNRLSESVQ